MHAAAQAGESEACRPDAGADGRSRNARKQEEFEDTFRVIENVASVREPNHQIGSKHSFQGVPKSNAKGAQDRSRCSQVDRERSQEDARPDFISEQ
jgi:hypothetical protein